MQTSFALAQKAKDSHAWATYSAEAQTLTTETRYTALPCPSVGLWTPSDTYSMLAPMLTLSVTGPEPLSVSLQYEDTWLSSTFFSKARQIQTKTAGVSVLRHMQLAQQEAMASGLL